MNVCEDCGEVCEVVEVAFDYAGTHCNHGKSGTHKTGEYETKCCSAGFEEGVSCESCEVEKHIDFMLDTEMGYFCEGCSGREG